jgi:hypothetical protein
MNLIEVSYEEKNRFYNAETMEEWMDKLPNQELEKWVSIANQDDFTEENISDIIYAAVIIYAMEMEMDSIELTDKLADSLKKSFLVNLIIFPLKKQGLIEVDEHIVLYKNYEMRPTVKGFSCVYDLKTIDMET